VTLWIDAQLPPAIAGWITGTYAVEAIAVRDLGLRDAEDMEIFQAANTGNAVVMTKDRDFVDLLERHGPPPRVIWIRCGNTPILDCERSLSRRFGTRLTCCTPERS